MTSASAITNSVNFILPLRSVFMRPNYMAQSAWHEHVPFAFWLTEAHRPRVFVELGSHYGVSYFAFCRAVDRLGLNTRCFAVDTWKGDAHAGLYGEEVFKAVKGHNDAHYSGFSRLVRSTFDDALKHFSDGQIDLLHIDGLHAFEDVEHDFTNWLPKLSARGVVVLHDTNVRERGFGVFRLFEQAKAKYPCFEFVHGHGLGVIGIGPDQNEPVKRLFESESDDFSRRIIHDVFSRLGRDCADTFAAHKRQRLMAELKASVEREREESKSRANEVAAIRQRFEESDQQARQLIEGLRQREADAKELKEALGQAEATTKVLTERLSRRDAEAKELKEALGQAEARAQQLAEKLAEQVAHTAGELSRRDAAAQENSEQLQLAIAATDRLCRYLEEEKSKCAELAQANTEADRELEQLKAELRRIRSSRAWKFLQLFKKVSETGRHMLLLRRAGSIERGEETASLVAASAFFDRDWYLARYQDVATAGIDPAGHYVRHGAAEGRDPGPKFSTRWYLDTHKDVAKAGLNPLVHYLLHGRTEGREIAPASVTPEKSGTTPDLNDGDVALVAASDIFDRDWYLARYQDVATAGIDPASHYVRRGAAEGRDPGPKFGTRWYLDTHKGVAKAGLNPLVHYLRHGRTEGREIAPAVGKKATVVSAPPVPAAPPLSTKATVVSAPPVPAAPPLSMTLPQPQDVPWVRQKDFVREDGRIAVALSGLLLGMAPAPDSAGPDAWQAIAEPARALTAFCRMAGADARQELRCYAGNSALDFADRLDALPDAGACPILSFAGAATKVAIADLWFTNDCDLRLRLGADPEAATGPCITRSFQYDLSGDATLVMVSECALRGQGIDFADVNLVNPFLPVLLTVTTPEGRLLAAALLPFPSLCRGGVHYGELCAVGTAASYLEDLQAVSGRLLGEMLGGTATAPEYSVARVDVDLQGATGAERIFSTAIRQWLAAIMHVKLGPANPSAVADAKARATLEQSLAALLPASQSGLSQRIADREAAGKLQLTLPADAVPSLHALVSRRLGTPAGISSAVGSFVITESATGMPEWAIKIPPMGEELLALQPASAAVCYPILMLQSSKGRDARTEHMHSVPLAIRFCDTRNRPEARLLIPVARDNSQPVLRRTMSDAAAEHSTISVLLPSCGSDTDAFAAFLESLHFQSLADKVDIIAMADELEPERKLVAEEALQLFFPGRYLLLEDGAGAHRPARVNIAASHAAGRYLLIAGEGIVLHDPRTLEILCVMADHDRVASAGCILVKQGTAKNAPEVVFRSGGLFLLDPDAPEPTLSEPDCYSAFPFGTYPVAGNSSKLFMVRADIWRKMGGFDATSLSDRHGDVEYGARAIAKGFIHFCTSAISAGIHREVDSDAVRAGVKAPFSVEAGLRQNIASSATILEALRG